jgi:ribosomal protein S18 acetylase RimI-like enzyme
MAMNDKIVIEPMTEKFILWRCLHFGPISIQTIDRWPSDSQISWELYRKRNIPLLRKLTRIYGAYAMLARLSEKIVGQLRFYPKFVCSMKGAGGLCLLQDFPNGPADDFAKKDFPHLQNIEDKTLVIHCLMTGSSQQKENPFQRKGIGTRMVRSLIQWAKANGWEFIEVDAFEDIPIIYEITGSAGITFWRKLGFRLADRHPHPFLQERNEFVETLEEQAKAIGISPDRARDRLLMRLDLA